MRIFLILLAISSSALAQQPDPVFLQKAIAAVQAQRDAANNNAAIETARAAMLADEVAKLKAEIEEMKKASAK
jgi:hypothetical protein